VKKINKQMGIKEFAIYVASELKKSGVDVILTGGAVVSIYSNNKYVSNDLDFLSSSDHQKITDAMFALGFKNEGKDFLHPNSDFYVEFPGRTLIIGNSPMQPEGEIKEGSFKLKLLSPTQCVMDRLAAFFHWKDRQSLDQAILVAKNHPVKLKELERWSASEGMEEKYKVFLTELKN
jgi:hypothetical protein